MTALKLAELNSAEALTSVYDKFGVTYLKLEDGKWLSNELVIVESSELTKKRPVLGGDVQ